MPPNYLLDHIDLLRQNRKPMYESCTIRESYPALEKTEINDTTSLEQSPRKILFAYDCESMPLYENQEECIRDYAEREAYWDIPTAISSESFVRGAVSTPEQSTSYSDARVPSSAETIDLVTLDLIQGNPPNAACYASLLQMLRKNYSFESSNNLNKKTFLCFKYYSKVSYFHFCLI